MTTEDKNEQAAESAATEAAAPETTGGLLDRAPFLGRGLMERLRLPRRLQLPFVIFHGAALGLIFAWALPMDWLVVPETTARADHTEHADGGQKAYYA